MSATDTTPPGMHDWQEQHLHRYLHALDMEDPDRRQQDRPARLDPVRGQEALVALG